MEPLVVICCLTVSYTHLDVYKRQLHPQLALVQLPIQPVTDTMEILRMVQESQKAGSRSVSYTHLVQRCIVHLIRNAIKYVPNKDYKRCLLYTS